MFSLVICVITAFALGIADASEPLKWVYIEATGSYITGAGGKNCRIMPDTFQVLADGKRYSSSEYNLTGSMNDDCEVSIILTLPFDDMPAGITGPWKTVPPVESTSKISEEKVEGRKKLNETMESIDEKLRIVKEKRDRLKAMVKEEAAERKRKLEEKRRKNEEGDGRGERGKQDEEDVERVQREEAKEIEEGKKNLAETKMKLEMDIEDLMTMKETLERDMEELKRQKEFIEYYGSEDEIAELDTRLKSVWSRWELYLKQIYEEERKLNLRQELLDSRLMLFEKRTKLTAMQKTLAEEKARLQASLDGFTRHKWEIKEKLDEERQRVERQREEWVQRLRDKRAQLRAKRGEVEGRRAKLRGRWTDLYTSATVRTMRRTMAVTKISGLQTRMEKVRADRNVAEEEGQVFVENIRLMYQSCIVADETIKIEVSSDIITNSGIEQLWVCSICTT